MRRWAMIRLWVRLGSYIFAIFAALLFLVGQIWFESFQREPFLISAVTIVVVGLLLGLYLATTLFERSRWKRWQATVDSDSSEIPGAPDGKHFMCELCMRRGYLGGQCRICEGEMLDIRDPKNEEQRERFNAMAGERRSRQVMFFAGAGIIALLVIVVAVSNLMVSQLCPSGATYHSVQRPLTIEVMEEWCEDDAEQKHGVFTAWHGKDRLRQRIHYVHGLKHGTEEHWHDNGQQRLKGESVDDKKVGFWTTWHANGALGEQGNWVDGKKEGLHERFYENGEKWSDGAYVQGEKTGVHKVWTQRGTQIEEKSYQDGKPHGPWTEWYENGSPKETGEYVDGDRQGEWEAWYETGQEKRAGSFEQSEREGEWIAWHANGEMKYRGSYAAGKKTGFWNTWHEDGLMADEGRYEAGERFGDWKEWYPSGRQKSEGVYLKGKSHGRWQTWSEKGVLEEDGGFFEGYYHGKVRTYDPHTGELKGISHYNEGTRVGQWTVYSDGVETQSWEYDAEGNLLE